MAKALPLPVVQSGLESSIDQVRRNIKPINVPVNVDPSAFKNLAQPLGRVSGLATEFEKSIAASNARVLAFGASVGIINGVQNAFASLLRTGIEVQKTLAEIAAISGQSGESLSKFGDSLFEVGKLTGQSFKIAAQAALEFSRQGLSTEETLKRTTDALTLTRFTTLNASEAVDVLTAAANSFADTGITTTEILNKLVAVDTKFAVSAEDLANGLARAGSIAQEVGVSFDELNAAITIAQERTARGGSVIGNALKTIFTRLRSDETVQALRSIGVESLNAQGGLKGAIPLLEEVAQKLQGLSEGERIQILEAIASKYNINILSAILTDLSDANKKFGEVVGISAGAGNQAYERQVELNKALAAQINITTVSVEQLFNKLAEIGVTESLGNLLKFVNGLLDGINKILDSESTGGNIAKGLIKGISDIFFTVGLPLLGAIFIKLTKDIAQFGVESLKTILGINQQVRERQALEQAVVNTLIRDQEIMATILSLSGNRAAQEEYLLSVYNKQLAALQQVQSIAAGVAPALQSAGLSATSGTVKRRAAEGYLPAAEARDVRRGVGGASPSSKVVEIPNFSFGGGKRGTMVANTSEYIVPNYAGGSGTAIFNQDMAKEYGLPPGAKKITASGGFIPVNGFIPNFVEKKLKGIGGLQGMELTYDFEKYVENTEKDPNTRQKKAPYILAGRIFESRAQNLKSINLQENEEAADITRGNYAISEAKLSLSAGAKDPQLAKGGLKGDSLLVPKTAIEDEASKKKLLEKGVSIIRKHKSITHDGLFGEAREIIKKYKKIPRDEIPNEIPISSASQGYIPNFINKGFIWKGTGERLEGYDPEGVVPAGNATRGKKWEQVKANYKEAEQDDLDAFAAKAAKQMNEGISVTAQHPAGAVMLVPKQEQAKAVNKESQGFGFKPKDSLKTPEGEGINFVKFAAFGVNDEKFKSKSGAKMSDIQMRIKTAIGSIGADIANDFKVLTKEPLDKDGFYKLFDKKQGAGGSVSAVAGSIFEAATDYTLNPAGNPNFTDPNTSFDVGSLTPNLIDVFDIEGNYGSGTKADFKISEARARAFADQVVLNNVYKKVDKSTGLAKAAKGYIPNFATPDPLSSLATANQFKKDSSSSASLEESINTAAKNAYKPFSKRRNITAGVSKNLVGNEAGTKKFRDALNSGIPVADFIGFQAATVGAPRPNISGKPEDLEKDLASLRFFNKDVNGPRPALRAVTTNPDESEVLAPASQFYDLKTAIGFAKAATVSLTSSPVGKRGVRGFVPNFVENEPLKEAIGREVAAGIAPARVRVTQDDRLQNSKNPEGLAVINTRDEPNGKIPSNFRKRAARQEVASAGFVPNFAKQNIDIGVFGKSFDKQTVDTIRTQINKLTEGVVAGEKSIQDFTDGAKKLAEQYKLTGTTLSKYDNEIKILSDAIVARKAAETKATATVVAATAAAAPAAAVAAAGGPPVGGPPAAPPAGAAPSGDGKSGKGLADSAEKTKVGLDKMFYALSGITTLSYTLQSVFKDSESAVAKFTVGVASAAQTASQFALLGGGVRELADSFKLGEKGGVLGKLGKASEALPIAGAVIGAGVGIYQAFADAEQRDRDKRISEVQKDYTRRVSLEEVGLDDQEKLQAAQKRLQDRRKEEADAEKELQRKLNDPSRLKNQKDSVADVRKRLEARKEEARIEEANVKGAQDAVDTNKKRSDRSASRNTAELEKRAVLEKELGKLSEAFSKAENDALLTRVRNRIKINEQVLLGTQYQKDEAALQLKLSDFENQKEDAKKATLEATIKELAGMSSLANVDKVALNQLIEKIKANKSLAGLEQEINALKGDGILRAKTALETQTNTLNRNLASIEAKRQELVLVDAYERKSKAILATEQLINQSIVDRIRDLDNLRSASVATDEERGGLQRQARVKRIEDEIGRQAFATPEQNLRLLQAQRENKQEEELSRIRAGAAKRLEDQYRRLRDELTKQAGTLTYLSPKYQTQLALQIDEANNIEDIAKRTARLLEIRTELFNQTPQTFQLVPDSPVKNAGSYTSPLSNFSSDFNNFIAESEKAKKTATEAADLPFYSRSAQPKSSTLDTFRSDFKKFTAETGANNAQATEFLKRKENAESTVERLIKAQEKAKKDGNELDAIRLELAIKTAMYEEKITAIRAKSQSAAGFTRAFDDLDKEAQGFTEKFSYDTTFAFRDGLRDALGAAISQTDDLNGALQAVALNFLKTMQNALLNNAVNTLMIGAGNAFPGVFGGLGKAKGGYIKGYASGGLVTGGSGYKDDVPAMLNGGEYVIRKSSVEKYGASNLQKLNSGDAPKFAAGGIFLPGVRGGTAISGYKDLTAFAKQTTTSGATDILMGGRSTAFASLEDQSARLSSYALLNEDDTINREIRSAQEQGLNLISEREKYRTQKRKAYQKQLVGTAISAALSFGLSKAFDTGVKSQVLSKQDYTPGGPTMTPYKVRGAYGGLIKTYSTGGGPTDNIPALLMDGEYVMSRKATSKYGKQFFDSINQGRAPRFADGGQVSTSEPSFAEKASAMSDSKATGGTNVSININVTGQSSQMQTEGETKDKGINYKEMSKQIEQIVLKTIAEQKRAGGMLKSGR